MNPRFFTEADSVERLDPEHGARNGISRRTFIKQAVCAAAGAAVPGLAIAAAHREVPFRVLGKTRQPVSILGLNAARLAGTEDQEEVIRLVKGAIDTYGRPVISLSQDHDNRSTALVGKALNQGNRKKAFITAGINGSDRESCLRDLERTLSLLQMDFLDLWLIDENIYRESPDRIFSSDGVIGAAVQARSKGKVRHIGFRGHVDPGFFSFMTSRYFEFEAVEIRMSGIGPYYRIFLKSILPGLLVRNIGIIAVDPMEALAAPHRLPPETLFSLLWSQLITTISAGIDSAQRLNQYAEIARNFRTIPRQRRGPIIDEIARVG